MSAEGAWREAFWRVFFWPQCLLEGHDWKPRCFRFSDKHVNEFVECDRCGKQTI